MKYAKITKETLDIKEVENGKEVSGNLTEQQIIGQGYKPLCEVENPSVAVVVKYVEYDSCIVQEWIIENVEEYEIYSTTNRRC